MMKSPEPISFKGTENILYQMNNCVCRIYNNCEATGFFTKIPYKNRLLPVLITNNHVIGISDLINNRIITLYLNNDKILKYIKLDKNRLRYTNEKLDVTIIEIIETKDNLNNKYLELDDNIINYFKFKEKEDPNYLNNIYTTKSIYIINYPEDQDVKVSYGQPSKIYNSEIRHYCSTKEGSSGSPILLINNQKLIGIHYGCSKSYGLNKGTLLIYSLIELGKNKNNLLIINKEGKYIDNNNEINNYIIAGIDIKENNQNIRIINSYEEWYRKNKFFKYKKECENEKEIRDNCEIRINDKIIRFCYFYEFKKKGKYNIKYAFKKNINNCICMFNECSSLINLDLSNFITSNVNNMYGMFLGCSSLKNINLSNFNTCKVTNMCYMFSGCSSLTRIDLSNFNTNNVSIMYGMFSECSSIDNIDLSNFRTYKVFNMCIMFYGCSSLTRIDLSNFNSNNVNDMQNMFSGCKNLTKNNIIVNDKNILEEFDYERIPIKYDYIK